MGHAAETAGFEYHLEGSLATGILYFADFIGHSLVIARQESAYWHHDIYLCRAVCNGQCGLGHLDLDKGLRGWETGAYGGYFHTIYLQTLAYQFGKNGVGADGCHMGQTGIFVCKTVYLLYHSQYLLIGIGSVERGKFYTAEQEAFYGFGIVFQHLFGDDLAYSLGHVSIADIAVVFRQCLLVLVHRCSLVGLCAVKAF